MNKLRIIIYIFLFTSNFYNCEASHLQGGSLTIQYAGIQNKYVLTYFEYGLPGWGQQTVTAESVSRGDSIDYIVTLDLSLTFALPGYNCVFNPGSSLISQSIYRDTIELPGPATDWIFTLRECCSAIVPNNIDYSGGLNGIYVDTRLDNLTFLNNSLPEVVAPSIAHFCLGQPAYYGFGATDIDGDSVSYSLIAPRSISGVYYPFAAGYSLYNITSITTPVVFDSINGSISFIPMDLGAYNFEVKITEYKNGIPSGYIVKNITFYIVNGISSVGITESENTKKIAVSPNPVQAEITISSIPENAESLIIINSIGQCVFKSEKLKIVTQEKFNLDVSFLSNGIYFINVNGKDFHYTSSFMKE